MSRTITDTATLLVDLQDAEGVAVGQVLVLITYLQDIDYRYGEDADGHRGALRVTYDILKSEIHPEETRQLTPAQVAQVLAEAEACFLQSPKHYV